MRGIIVNYHYIRREKLRGLNPCTEERFREQLDYLRANYTMTGVADVYRAAKAGTPGRFCALTFDDGLKEHYRFIFPLLAEQRIPGTFFLSGEVLRDRKVALTHKLQLLLHRFDIRALVDLFHVHFKNRYRIDDHVSMNPKRRFDDVLTVNFKETLIALPLAERRAFIDRAFSKQYDEEQVADDLFLDSREATAMLRGGMTIGLHGFRHLSLDALAPAEQRVDVTLGKSALEETLGMPTDTFSYPHGRANEATLNILRENGFAYGVTIKPEEVSFATDPLLIPRYDTNDILIA